MEDLANTKLLVNNILSGETNGFNEIIENYKRLVSHIVFKMVPNNFDREDLCQDVFVKVYQNLGKFKFESKLSTWIARIAYNRCINFLEKKKVPLFDDVVKNEEITVDSMESNVKTPEAVVEERNLSDILNSEINQLPKQYPLIVTLYHIDELTYEEIGKITGMPDGTVKSHLFRGRKLLKDRLVLKYNKEDLCQ